MFTNLMFHTQNGADKAAIKGYGAGYSACHGIARAAIAGMKACSEGKRRHQEALDKRAQEWADFQSFLNNGGAKKDEPKKAAPKQEPVDPEPVPQQPSNGWTDITDGGDNDEEVDLSHAEF